MASTTGSSGTPTAHHTARHAPTSSACLIPLYHYSGFFFLSSAGTKKSVSKETQKIIFNWKFQECLTWNRQSMDKNWFWGGKDGVNAHNT
jgi:hypothetical protein